MRRWGWRSIAGWVPVFFWLHCNAQAAGVAVTDDAGHALALSAPARRIISLAPHATELLFAAGAGDRVVGVSDYSNYPPQAKQIVSVGGATTLDFERIVMLKPDLVVAWGSGTPAGQIARLRALGLPVFESEPRDFEAVATSLERLSVLAATEATGKTAARQFRLALQGLREKYSNRKQLSVFFQVWQAPLITLNDAHMVSAALKVCGARNIFGALPQVAPTVSIEAVLQADPDAIVSNGNEQDDALKTWRRFPKLKAVSHRNLLLIPGDTLTRAGPRIVDATRVLCEALEKARGR
jgi:iron complex transport system substrate-binding protein